MDKDAIIGPIDPQIGDFYAELILPLPGSMPQKQKRKADDTTLVMSDISRKP